MKITDARVIVCCPGRNFVTLKIETDQGLTGLGDATLNGRELAVASYLTDHVVPCLIGRDAHQIEDIWQYLYRGAYWRRGPVTMSAIAAVDTALWDLKAKAAGLPLYQLLGGASRSRRAGLWPCQRARHRADSRRGAALQGHGLPGDPRAERRAGAGEGVWRRPRHAVLRTCRRVAAFRARLGHAQVPGAHAQAVRGGARGGGPRHPPAARCAPPADADRGRAAGQGPRALPPVLDGRCDAGREPGRLPADPPAHHDAAGRRRGVQHHLGLQEPDREPARSTTSARPWSMPAASRICAASPTSRRCTRCAPAARRDGPVAGVHGRGAALRPVGAQLRHPGVHAPHRRDRRGVPACLHLRGRLHAPRAKCRATASRSTRHWPRSTRTSAPTCRSTGCSTTARYGTGDAAASFDTRRIAGGGAAPDL